MPITPTLIVGVGDAGAQAVAESKNRIHRLLKGNAPGIAFLAILSDDSATVRRSNELAKRISQKLSGIVAEELTYASSNLRKGPDPEEILGKRWLGDFASPKPALFDKIMSELAKKNADSPPKSDGATGSHTSSTNHDNDCNLKLDCVSHAVNDTASRAYNSAKGLIPQQLAHLLSQIETLLLDVTMARACVGFEFPNASSSSAKKGAENPLAHAAYDIFMDAVRSLVSQVRSMATEASSAASLVIHAVSRGYHNAGIALSQDDVATALGYSNASQQIEKDASSIAETILSQFGGALGIANDPDGFDKALSDACSDWISKSNPDGVIWLMLGESDDFRLEKLDPGEYLILSPSKYEPQDSSDPSATCWGTLTRRAIHQAFFDEQASGRLAMDVDKTISMFDSAKTKIDMKESLSKLGLPVVETPVTVFAIADVADPMGGELIQDITGMVLQTCERHGLPADITGILIIPRAISSIRSAAPPQARAYASLKEICHWWSKHRYDHQDEDLHITADRPLFNSVYIIESPEFGAEKSARIVSCPIADFLSVMMLYEKGSFGPGGEIAPTGYTKYPISSFGTGRLHYPATSVAEYNALGIAHHFALSAAERQPIDANGQLGLSLWAPPMQISDIVKNYAGKTDRVAVQSFRSRVSEWFESVRVETARELDEAPVGERFTRALSVADAATDAISEAMPRMAQSELADAVRRRVSLEDQISEDKQNLNKASKGNAELGITAVVLLAAGLLPIWMPALGLIAPGLAAAAAAISGQAAPWIMAAGLAGAAAFSGHTGKRVQTVRVLKESIKEREGQLHDIVDNLESQLDPMEFKYVYLVITQWRVESLRNNIIALYGIMYENIEAWKSATDAAAASLPLDKLTADKSGNVTVITRDFLGRELERVKSRVLTDHCSVKLSPYLGWSGSAVSIDLPRQIRGIMDSLGLGRRTCISVLEDMANADEPVTRFLDALRIGSEPMLNVNEAKIGLKPSPLMILSLGDPDTVKKPPLAQALPAVGVDPAAGSFTTCSTWDDMSIVLCQTWNRPVEIISLLPLPEYFRSYISTGCNEMLTSDPTLHTSMEDICDILDESKAKSIMVQALALDLLRPPYDPIPLGTASKEARCHVDSSTNRAILDALNSDPERVDALAHLINERCGEADPQCVVSWLEWVIHNRQWWEGILGLVEPDLRYVRNLMEDLRSGRKPGGIEL